MKALPGSPPTRRGCFSLRCFLALHAAWLCSGENLNAYEISKSENIVGVNETSRSTSVDEKERSVGHAQTIQHSQMDLALAKIDQALLEVSTEQERERLRSAIAVQAASRIIRALTIPTLLPPPEVCAEIQEGELEQLDVTWRNNGKFLRLITYGSDKRPKIYFHVDSEDPFTRAHSIQSTYAAAVLNDKLNWLLA